MSGGGGDIWNVDGALGDSFGNWGAEVTGGYHSSGGSSGNAGGAIYYAGTSYRLAVSGNYLDLGGLHLANYGVGGEWFASQQFTVALRGGGVSGSGGTSGGYGGGDVKFYVMPNLALSAGGDYIDLSGVGISSEDIRAEWLISQNFPVSIFGGYSHVEAGSSGDVLLRRHQALPERSGRRHAWWIASAAAISATRTTACRASRQGAAQAEVFVRRKSRAALRPRFSLMPRFTTPAPYHHRSAAASWRRTRPGKRRAT